MQPSLAAAAQETVAPVVRTAGRSALPPAFTASLSPEERSAFEALRPAVRRLQVGQVLYEQGDSSEFVYLLIDGWAFRYRTLGDGRRAARTRQDDHENP